MHKPRVTILMPVYNAERFLKEAIDSVLQQTFSDFEFLILDDGSTDRSVAIIQSYSDPRIRLYQNESNQGISATLNKGIELAATEVIARMDADDICYPDRLQKQWEYLQAHPDCALVSSRVRVITETGTVIRQDDYKSPYYYYNLTFECWIYHPTITFRKAAVQEIGGYTVSYSEDFELFWHLSRKYKMHNLPEVLLDYRVTSQSLHQVQKKNEYDTAQELQVMRNLQYYTENPLQISPACLACLRHNFKPLLDRGCVDDIVECLRALDSITAGILKKPNPNRDLQAIQEAAFFKRRFILLSFIGQLPRHKALYLIIKAGAWWYLKSLIKKRLKTKN